MEAWRNAVNQTEPGIYDLALTQPENPAAHRSQLQKTVPSNAFHHRFQVAYICGSGYYLRHIHLLHAKHVHLGGGLGRAATIPQC